MGPNTAAGTTTPREPVSIWTKCARPPPIEAVNPQPWSKFWLFVFGIRNVTDFLPGKPRCFGWNDISANAGPETAVTMIGFAT